MEDCKFSQDQTGLPNRPRPGPTLVPRPSLGRLSLVPFIPFTSTITTRLQDANHCQPGLRLPSALPLGSGSLNQTPSQRLLLGLCLHSRSASKIGVCLCQTDALVPGIGRIYKLQGVLIQHLSWSQKGCLLTQHKCIGRSHFTWDSRNQGPKILNLPGP